MQSDRDVPDIVDRSQLQLMLEKAQGYDFIIMVKGMISFLEILICFNINVQNSISFQGIKYATCKYT